MNSFAFWISFLLINITLVNASWRNCSRRTFILTVQHSRSSFPHTHTNNNNNNNNNLRLTVVKTNRSTLHTVNNIQQSVTQDSSNNPWGYRLPETDGANVLPASDQVGLYLASIHQMASPEHTSDKQACYSFIDPWKIKGWVGLVGSTVAGGLPT